MNSHQKSTLLGFGAIFFWSTTYALVRSISEHLGGLMAGACIFGIAGFGGILYAGVTRKQFLQFFKIPLKYVLTCGSLLVFYILSLYLSIEFAANRQQLLEIAVVGYLWPSLAILFSLFISGKRARWWIAPGMILALTGATLAIFQQTAFSWHEFVQNILKNPLPYSLSFSGAILWAVYSNLSRKWNDQNSIASLTIFMLMVGVALTVLTFFFPHESHWLPRTVAEILFLGIAVLLGYTFWDIGMKKGDIVLLASCAYFGPILSTIVSCIYLNVVAGWKIWAGCALVVMGSILSRTSVKN